MDKIQKYAEIFQKSQFPVLTLSNYNVVSAIEAFVRVNTTGKKLTIFEIMRARTYDEHFNMKKK